MSAILQRLCVMCIVPALALLPGLVLADNGPAAPSGPWAWTGDAAGLHCLSLCELEDLYRRGTVHTLPCGFHPGEVITFTDMPGAKLAKRLADRYWVGKHIDADGHFINQWRHGKALQSCLFVGPSYVDCNPALVFEYPWYTPLFGPMRDEYREIAPGLYLGKMYRRRPCVRFLGYNYLQRQPCGTFTSAPLVQVEPMTSEPPTATSYDSPPPVKPEKPTR